MILATIVFSSLITLVSTAIQLYRDYRRDLSLIDSQLAQIQEVHLRSIAGNLWLLDDKGLQILVDGMVQLPDILYLEVSDGERIWAQSGSNQADNIIKREFPLRYDHLGDTREIGVLTAVATLDRVYQRLIDKAIDILVSNAIKTFLVAGFMLLLFYFLVTRHLVEIAGFLRNQDLEQDGETLRLARKPSSDPRPDEIDLVVDELNLTRATLQRSYDTLKKSESRFRELFDNMAQGVIYRDDNGRIRMANEAAQKILGLSLEDMRDNVDVNSTWKVIQESGEPLADAAFPTARSLRTGEGSDNLVLGIFHPIEQKYRWLLTSAMPSSSTDDDGTRLAFSTFTDITARKQADQEREKLINELEIKNRELERFVYTISHELKTPLVTIAGFSGILANDVEQGDREKLVSHLGYITSAVDNMSVLLDELLELSRVGRIINTPENISMRDLIRDVAQMLGQQAAARGVTLEIAADFPEAFGDRLRLREVVQNLAENAIKFSGGRSGAHVRIGWRDEDPDPVYFVQDNGRGIEPPYQERIFDLFERLEPEIEGTGVGLALVKRIMEEHGGRIWVESEGLGSGSTFCFTLPGATAR